LYLALRSIVQLVSKLLFSLRHCTDRPPGNCTYDPFYTLAFDFQCKPLSKLLEFGCRNASAEWMIPLVDQGAGKNPTMASCGWYMDPGPEFQLQLMSGYEITDNGTIGAILATRFFPIQDLVSNRLAFGGSPNFKNIQAPVTDFILASTPGGFDGAIKNNTPILTECEIHWVVNLLNATVLAGILEENLIEILQFESNLTGPYAPWDGLDGSDYMANFSMTLRDPHAFTPDGMSTFGLDNITAFKVFQAWEELAQSALILPINTGGNKDRGHGLKMTWWRTRMLPAPLTEYS
jgi:hypothetical protein